MKTCSMGFQSGPKVRKHLLCSFQLSMKLKLILSTGITKIGKKKSCLDHQS